MLKQLKTAAVAAAIGLAPQPALGQTDYRNLDAGRPLRIADAWPIEQKALELLAGWRTSRASGGAATHDAGIAVTWGLLPNMQFEVAVHGASSPGVGGRSTTLKDPEAALLFNIAVERGLLPALALQAGYADGEPQAGAVATRSFGRQRLHLAGMYSADDSWWYGGALDRTLYRRSILAALEVTARREAPGLPVLLATAAGARLQLTPEMVLDAGIEHQWRSQAPREWAFTIGLTRMIPTRASLGGNASSNRTEWSYAPGRWNWEFLYRFKEAAGLFNAFDYGHAVLYERLWQYPDSARAAAALQREFDFLTRDLLVRTPRFSVAEPAIAPEYARIAWRAKLVFDWAHVLHRQIYDIYADPSLSDAARSAAVERLTDYYLMNRSLALVAVPKEMALMDEQPYSQVFRRRHVAFNGLIWAYHWLQVGLYEPLIAGTTEQAQRDGIAATLVRFREMISSQSNMPSVMPMTTAIAPAFTARHERAAAIFDNLHMLHDIISDILVSDVVPRGQKAAAIRAAISEFQNAERNVTDREHWLMMADHMGGIDAMGGAVPGSAAPRPVHNH